MIGRPNIVIVDDHAMFREALRDYIASSDCGTSVRAVADLDTAEHLVLETRNVLVLLDISLGDKSGIEGIPRLRRAAGRRGLYILCISMHGRASIVRAALDSGADGYISKGSSGDRLIGRSGKSRLAESSLIRTCKSSSQRYSASCSPPARVSPTCHARFPQLDGTDFRS